ncbi:hypothetical protein [Streptomyces sp. x-80]
MSCRAADHRNFTEKDFTVHARVKTRIDERGARNTRDTTRSCFETWPSH